MPRTTLTSQLIVPGGLAPTYGAVDALGATFRNSGKSFVHVKNGSVSSINVTAVIGKKVLGVSVTSPTVAVAAGADKFFGPFVDDYEQPGGTDTMYIDFSAVASVTVALLTT